jgi:TolA-binding protein
MPPVSKVKRRDLKEDKVYLTLASVADFFVRNRLWIGLAVLVVVLTFALAYYRHLRFQHESAEASLALYNAMKETSDEAAALKKVAIEYKGTETAPIASYELANTFYNQGHYDEASAAFKEFLKQYPNHLLAPSAMEAMGYCYESLDQWKEAIGAYENIIKKWPSSPEAKRANYRIGLCYEHLGDKQKAIDAYKKTIDLLPNTLWAEYSNEQLSSLSPSDVISKETEPPPEKVETSPENS